jgi:hypothetical protein
LFFITWNAWCYHPLNNFFFFNFMIHTPLELKEGFLIVRIPPSTGGGVLAERY